MCTNPSLITPVPKKRLSDCSQPPLLQPRRPNYPDSLDSLQSCSVAVCGLLLVGLAIPSKEKAYLPG
ncbi:hypothetical protein COCVIDRAFT_83148 [Bipolaris victoriae FI3]|uniref:Uncharacterized protein n=2 Tax=Bipolaris TaxID=33194 RepID=W6YEX7_COCC2|nr:uncharacterized protein COCCADRAFT_105663 [Bipolaris zeicola 26-R-13]XP_014562759.1 hypothetical protein COCVIDRAFT_83148 [Bipolaris victoriae FI3]EUC29776.1 hypothetical protein COCCADRAFT_105663 [Bipolaris zeicola 26-R-13]